jgi:hypothetical protein
MAVYKKDGSVYKLNGPNNLMISQEKWGSFVAHNLKNLSNLKIESNTPHVVLGSKKEPEIKKETITFVQTPSTEKIDIKQDTLEIKEKPLENNYFDGFQRTVMHCALAKLEEIKDELYNDVHIKKKYIDSFTFECIVLSLNDFTLIFWTMLDNLSVGSVVYPQNDSKRWWEIKEIESVPGGHKVICITAKNTLAF